MKLVQSNWLFKALLCVVALLICPNVSAWHDTSSEEWSYSYECDFTVEGIHYSIKDNGSEVSVCGNGYNVTTGDDYSTVDWFSDYTGVITIPSEVFYNGRTYSVSAIENYAFTNFSTTSNSDDGTFKGTKITKVIMPESVKSIGYGAFVGCTSLEIVECHSLTPPTLLVADGGPNCFENISDATLFVSCEVVSDYDSWCTFFSKIDVMPVDYTDENGVVWTYYVDSNNEAFITKISNYPSHLVVPEKMIGRSEYTVTTIGARGEGYGPLSWSKTIESVELPYGLKTIEHDAFSYSSLSSVLIPETVETIGAAAFTNCKQLTSFELPRNLKLIEEAAFAGSGLASITIPASVQALRKRAFVDCVSLKSVSFEDCDEVITVYSGKFSDGIGGGQFDNCPVETAYIGRNIQVVKTGNRQYECGVFADRNYNYSTHLKSITIGEKVSSIECIGFGSHYLEEITIKATTPPAFEEGFSHGTPDNDTKIYVPAESLSEYESSPWNNANIGTLVAVPSEPHVKLFFADGTIQIDVFENGIIPQSQYSSRENIVGAKIGEGITSIGNYAFKNCSSLVSIEIPSSVTSIGSGAFNGCSSMESMTLPFVGASANATTASLSTLFGYIFGTERYDGGEAIAQPYNSNLQYGTFYIPSSLKNVTINGGDLLFGAFYNCFWLESVKLGEGVNLIGTGVFNSCTSLASIELSSSITSIGDAAFQKCQSLSSIEIPSSVVTIGNHAFRECSMLSSVNIPSGVTTIGTSVFDGCSALTFIDISNSVTSIGEYAFSGCSNLTSLKLGEGVRFIDTKAFSGCSAIASIYITDLIAWCSIDGLYEFVRGCANASLYINGESAEQLIIPDALTSIPDGAFSGFNNINSVSIPKGIQSVGKEAFANCRSLSNVVFEDGVKIIGEKAFYSCTSLASLVLPSSVTEIGVSAFNGCSSLASIAIPSSVTKIGNLAFAYCSNVTSIYYDARSCSNLAANNGVFSKAGQSASGITVTIGKDVENIPTYLFYCRNSAGYDPKIISVDFEESNLCKNVGSYAFGNCPSLVSIEIPSNVTSIGGSAFYGCSNLASINISDPAAWCNISGLNSLMFYGTSSKTLYINDEEAEDFVIPEGTTIIPDYAFYRFANIKSVTIPSSVNSIGICAFWDCTSLTSVKIEKGVTSIGDNAFMDCASLTSIEIPSGVTSISSSAFAGSGLRSIRIPSSVEWIGSYAFGLCRELTTVEIPSGNVALGGNVFQNCHKLETANLRGVTSMENGCDFQYDNLLTTVQFSDELQSIGNSTFEECTKLRFANIPSSVTSFGERAFFNCSNFVGDVTFSENIESIGRYAFAGSGITRFDLPAKNYIEIGDMAFACCPRLQECKMSANIGQGCFLNCKKLKKVALLEGSDVISYFGFFGCESLQSISFPSTLIDIRDYAFTSCKNLTDFHIASVDNWINLIMGESGESEMANPLLANDLPHRLYVNGEVLKEIDLTQLNESMGSLRNFAFYNCVDISQVKVSAEVETLMERAFAWTGELPDIKDQYYDLVCTMYNSYDISAIQEELNNKSDWQESNRRSANSAPSKIASASSVYNSIGAYAFYGCTGLQRIELPETVSTIQSNCFDGCLAQIILNCQPPTFDSDDVTLPLTTWIIPAEYYDDYMANAPWNTMSEYIISSNAERVYNITVAAQPETSNVYGKIGELNLRNVTDLTLKGSINGYDILIIRNRMNNLRNLDLSEAKIVYNPQEYYVGYHTTDNVLGDYMFEGQSKLYSVKLPATLEHIGKSVFENCDNLREVTFAGENVETVGARTFKGCRSLNSITLPAGVKEIEEEAFIGCSNLTFVDFPVSLLKIGEKAFADCGFTSIQLPPALEVIGEDAFNGSSLREVRVPSSVRTIEDGAFKCPDLAAVYTYTIEPTAINQNTFSNWKTVMLYVPPTSFYKYYWNAGWSQFTASNIQEFDEEYEYEYFYLNNDYTPDGVIDGTPDADLNAGSAFIMATDVEEGSSRRKVQGSGEVQHLNVVNIKYDDEKCASVIASDNNIVAEKAMVEINVKGGQWHFFSFPFDIQRGAIEYDGNYVFRYYDGAKRAAGEGGWQDIDSSDNLLHAGRGYIFHCSKDGVLRLPADAPQFGGSDDAVVNLVAHSTTNAQDANWNYVGNPYVSYYKLDGISYEAPVTVWNGQTYETIRKGDDDYDFAPFQAFFVQGIESDEFSFAQSARTTYQQLVQEAETGKHVRAAKEDDGRHLVNLVISNGTVSDKTRVVFNEEKSMAYEADCDASKFIASGMPQVYSLGANVKYSINERPVADGFVQLGYISAASAVYTLDVQRMDVPVLLKDNTTGKIHDFADGAYEFMSEAGEFNQRFSLIINGETGIDNISIEKESHNEIYSLEGKHVKGVKAGVNVITDGAKGTKVLVK